MRNTICLTRGDKIYSKLKHLGIKFSWQQSDIQSQDQIFCTIKSIVLQSHTDGTVTKITAPSLPVNTSAVSVA